MKKLTLSVLVLILTAGVSFAQLKRSDEGGTPNEEQVPKSRMDQHEAFLDGEYRFPSKPRNMWVVGVEGGYAQVSGDVNPDFGWGAGLNARKALGYATSIRFGAQYLRPEGEDLEGSRSYIGAKKNGELGGGWNPQSGTYLHSFESTAIMPFAEFVLNVNNINFHREQNKFNVEVSLGPAAYMFETETTFNDLQGSTGANVNGSSATMNRNNSRSTRRGGTLGDYNVVPAWTTALGLSYRMSDRVSLSLRPRLTGTWDDYLDGEEKGDTGTNGLDLQDSGDKDKIFTANAGLEFALGNKDKRTQPLWWENPMNYAYSYLKDDFEFDEDYLFEDEDNDGVINRMDKEPNSPCDFVDGAGRVIDSDKDGIPDCNDACPFTPAALVNEIDENGCTPEPEDKHCCDEIADLKKQMTDNRTNFGTGGTTVITDQCASVSYPQVSFASNSKRVAATQNAKVQEIAQKLAANPTCNIVIEGFATGRRKVANQAAWARAIAVRDALTKNYGVSSDRIIVKYSGVDAYGDVVMVRSARPGESGSSNPAAPAPGF